MSQVSTIIPVYNGERYLQEAVMSVVSQTGVAQDVWIIDDGSTDGTPAIADALAVQSQPVTVNVIHQENAGASAARNYGVRRSKGAFVAFLDADDVWTPGRLRLMLNAFEDNPSLDVVMGYVEQFHSPELDEAQRARLYCPDKPMPGHHPAGIVMRREAFAAVGEFDPAFRNGEVVDWVIRLHDARLQTKLLPNVVFRRRIHGTNKILTPFAQNVYPSILKAALDRRRRQSDAGTL
jgi:glycosyltransferase involved in cell wall biosynthesis